MKYVIGLVLVCMLATAAYLTIFFYPYVFSETVEGKLEAVERAGSNTLTADRTIAFAFAIAIKTAEGVVTASSDDRQWAVVKQGMCARVKLFPYPPWEMDKAGTFYGARLLKLYECAD